MRKPLEIAGIGLLVVVLLSVLGASHGYLIERLVLAPGLPAPVTALAGGTVLMLALSLVLHPIAERLLSPRVSQWLAWPSSIWMALAFWLLLLVAVSDGILWLAGASAEAASYDPAARVGLERSRALLVVGIALCAAVPALISGLSPPKVKRVAIRLPRWPRDWAGFRIVQISDIHIGSLLDRRFAKLVTERVNALEPDLIAVTGDVVDGPVDKLADEVAPFGELRARHGVYFVTGNHDHYAGVNAWVDELKKLGMQPLRNERVSISPRPRDSSAENVGLSEIGFELAGVDDYRSRRMPGEGGADLDSALRGLDADRFVLLLSHDPSTFNQAAKAGVDLQLSGHTHGGQIWPFHYFVRLAVPFVAGLYRRGISRLYVSRGTGFWGPPMRLGAPAEITEIALLPALAPGAPQKADAG